MTLRNKIMTSIKIFDAVTIAAGQTALSEVIELPSLMSIGYFSLDIEITGTGFIDCDYLSSNDTSSTRTMRKPEGEAYILKGAGATSGNSGDGELIKSFKSIPSIYEQIRIVETLGVNSVTITAYLNIIGMD